MKTDKLFKKELKKLYCEISDSGTPYVGYVFSLYLFTEKLYKKCKSDGVKNLFFLSREGQFLKKLFDLYLQFSDDNSIHTHYFYTSRISSFVPSLKSIDKESFDTLFFSYKNISISAFMKNCGFTEDDISEVSETLDFDVFKAVDDTEHSKELEVLKKNTLFINKYDKIRKEQHRLFLSYVDSFGVDISDEGFNIVDVGWKGTIQDNFYRIFGDSIQIHGYYLGLNEKTNYNNFTKKDSVLFSKVNGYTPFFDVWSYDYSFFERLLFANHGSVKNYSENQGSTQPIPNTLFYNDEKTNYEIIRPIQEAIEESFNILSKKIENISLNTANYESQLSKTHLKNVLEYEPENRQIQARMLEHHIENFGVFVFINDYSGYDSSFITSLKNVLLFNHRQRSFIMTSLLQTCLKTRNSQNVIYKLSKSLAFFFFKIYSLKQTRRINEKCV